jgi:hypothetical protein
VSLLLALAACDLRRWRDETPPAEADADVDADADADADTDADADVPTADTAAPCPEDALGPAPDALSGDTTGRSDDHAGSCGGTGAGDVVVAFTAEAAGVHTFDTVGSAFPAVLYALDGCDGAELACDAGTGSSLDLDLAAGETVWLVVDGRNEQEGPFALSVSPPPPPCADLALPATVPTSGAGDTTAAGDADLPPGTCSGGGTGPEQTWSFTAPAAATYTFDTLSAGFDTVLYVRDGCGGAVLACNDDLDYPYVLQSQLTVSLAAGQAVVVVVDGYDAGEFGAYELAVR